MAHNVETMFSVRQIPWHKLGKLLENPPTSEEAVIQAGLDWEVSLKPIYFKNEDENTPHSFDEVKNRSAVVRDSDGEPLSIVSNNYKPLQNREAFKWFDEIVDQGKATYETAGSLLGGKKIWILAKMKEDFDVVPSDTIRQYILLCNGHDGITSIMIQPTNIRVVCENTLNKSLGTGLVHGVWHHGDIGRKMDNINRLLGLAQRSMNGQKEIYKDMVRCKMNSIKVGEYINALIPDANKDATEKVKLKVDLSRQRIVNLFETGMGTDIPGVKGTLWGLYNAAIEFCDYDMPKKVRDIPNYQLFGIGAKFKERAFDNAVALME